MMRIILAAVWLTALPAVALPKLETRVGKAIFLEIDDSVEVTAVDPEIVGIDIYKGRFLVRGLLMRHTQLQIRHASGEVERRDVVVHKRDTKKDLQEMRAELPL